MVVGAHPSGVGLLVPAVALVHELDLPGLVHAHQRLLLPVRHQDVTVHGGEEGRLLEDVDAVLLALDGAKTAPRDVDDVDGWRELAGPGHVDRAQRRDGPVVFACPHGRLKRQRLLALWTKKASLYPVCAALKHLARKTALKTSQWRLHVRTVV